MLYFRVPLSSDGRSRMARSTDRSGVKRARARASRVPQQDRGEQRVESILDAAEELIAEVGVDGVTTNAIAARAGASMGSLYHFFPHKEAILDAITERHTRKIREVNEKALAIDNADLPLPQLFERVVMGHAERHRRSPAFGPVHEALARRGRHLKAFAELNEAMVGSIERYLAARYPKMPTPTRRLRARACYTTVHGLLEESLRIEPREREPWLREVIRMMVAYWEPVDHEYGVRADRLS
jgi:AcrR family transcriptional regulator